MEVGSGARSGAGHREPPVVQRQAIVLNTVGGPINVERTDYGYHFARNVRTGGMRWRHRTLIRWQSVLESSKSGSVRSEQKYAKHIRHEPKRPEAYPGLRVPHPLLWLQA